MFHLFGSIQLAADEELKTLNAYGVLGEKTMFGRKYMGVVRTSFLLDYTKLEIRI